MKKTLFLLLAMMAASQVNAQTSPDGKLSVAVKCENEKPVYSITLNGKTVIMDSPLGLNTNIGYFTEGLTLSKTSDSKSVTADYINYKLKRSHNHYEANSQVYTFSQKVKGRGGEQQVDVMNVEFQVSNNNVAMRYEILPTRRDTKVAVINSEATGYTFPEGTTTFICPQMGEMTGFARTAPSYETHYEPDAEMGKNGWGQGYTFPCLFKEQGAWVLISETGTYDGNYCGCKIENVKGGEYKISFPSMKENNGYGTNTVQTWAPGKTPWRTYTIAEDLKPIVESTITWDVLANEVAQPRMIPEPKGTRGAWSWIIAGDGSCNYDTQKKYIDFAAAMGWETLLVDALWDVQIGRDRIAELAAYGKQKGVGLYLWYNSNGKWNDAPQSPLNCMDDMTRRRQEMDWMQSIGIKGIKVDFFGGDKQCTLQLYHDILMEAAAHDICVIFHGCTLPRGWEILYPNYVASEAVRASENMNFSQGECDGEATDATYFPFIRNAVGSMDFGGSTLNKFYNAANNHGSRRVTSDVFALATAVMFQSSVQHFAMAPNNLEDANAWAVDFMKKVPTTWDDVKFIDGYPGKYAVLARKATNGKWYLCGINAQKEPLKMKLTLDMFNAGDELTIYSDDAQLNGSVKPLKLNKKKQVAVEIPCNGGLVIM